MEKADLSLPALADILNDNPGWLDEAVNANAASKMTAVPVCTLATWRSRGEGPGFIKLGRSVRYRRRALFEWMARGESGEREAKDARHG